MQYGVPSNLGISDVEDGVESWQLVYPIIAWTSVEEIEGTGGDEHTDKEHAHFGELWFPAVLRPCSSPGGHAPAMTWFGPMFVVETRAEATAYAVYVLKKLRSERDALEQALTDLTTAAANGENEKS